MSRRFASAVAVVVALVAPLVAASPALALGYAQSTVVSANPVDYTPDVLDNNVLDNSNGSATVLAIAPVGNVVYVGGNFTTVRNANTTANITRNYLFAFDRTTGRVTTFAPAVNGIVQTIMPAPDGQSIIIGGNFSTVQGATQRSLAMLRPDGSRVTTFTASTNGQVNKVLVRGNRLFAGGRFGTANGVARSNLAAFNATTGALDTTFNLPVTQGRTKSGGTTTSANVYEMDANAAGTRLVILGNFRSVGGQKRMQVAMVDLSANEVSPWFTNRYPNDQTGALAFQCYQVFDTQMRDVEFSPDGGYFVLVDTGGASDLNRSSLCDTASRWETNATVGANGAQPTWFNCTGGDTLFSVAVTAQADSTGRTTGGAVYVGGHQRWLDNCGGRDSSVAGSFSVSGIGAIDANTGKAIRTWNPTRTRGVGAEELVAQAEGLYVGSDTEQLGHEYHARLGLFPSS